MSEQRRGESEGSEEHRELARLRRLGGHLYPIEELREAAGKGFLEVVRFLVEECGANVNAKDNNGWTALMKASERGHTQMACFLVLACGADVNAKDNNGWTAFVLAAEKGSFEVAFSLVEEYGADVNTKDNDGWTALMRAAERGDIAVARFLVVECGSDVNATNNDGWTALTQATDRDDIEVARFLVAECGSDVNAMNNYGWTALMCTAERGDIAVARFLVVECGADVNAMNKYGWTALMRAAQGGHIEVARFLVAKCGADVNAKNKYGWTALMRAAQGGHIEVARFLVAKCGADVNAMNRNECSAFMLAVEKDHIAVALFLIEECRAHVNTIAGQTALVRAAQGNHIGVARFLVAECDADVNALNKNGRTALMLAAELGHIAVARVFVEECGADVNATDNAKWTALLWAAQGGHIRIVRCLAAEGRSDVNAMDNNKRTALMCAARGGHIEVVRFFVEECGVDVNATDNDGWTALMCATRGGHIKVVRFLVKQRGAHVDIKNNDGHTAIRLAVDRGYDDIRRLLTPFVLPGHESPTSDTTGTVEHKRLSYNGSANCSIPPSEVVLCEFCENGDIGGDFRAKWLDADAIVKLFVPDASHSSFEQEVRMWQELRHPNVLKLYGACDAGPQLQLFVCEYASKGSLAEYVHASSSKEKPLMWTYLHEAALGLAYLHERGIVHGDLRCSNILIGSDGIAKLSDFGLIDSDNISSLKERAGSMWWQSPEAVEGSLPSFESDVYSLGMCILEAETGKIPWGGSKCAKDVKLTWMPELIYDDDEANSGYSYSSDDDAPDCPYGDARNLVWRMCSSDPGKRASLPSIVYELERLSIQECSGSSQAELESTSCFDDYKGGKMLELWLKLQAYMEECDNVIYRRSFSKLKRVHERLHGSTQKPILLQRFCSVLTDFCQTVKMSPERTRIMRLSSTRATTTSSYAIDWRIEALLAALGESTWIVTETRWQQQRSNQIAAFVSGVSDMFLVLKDLKSVEERSAFLRMLKAEMENSQGKYTPEHLQTMKKAHDEIASKMETEGDLAKLIPDWFIPWYELIIDEWGLLGSGGFGSVFRAKWLDSDVVMKQVILPGSTGSSEMSTLWSLAYSDWLSVDLYRGVMSEPTTVDDSKKKEAVAMFQREVDIWFGFSHPHVVQLFGACHIGRPFFVCEYATYGTLVSYLRGHPDELWTKLHEAALGVQYLHARGVVHGDLKGNNIVIGSDLKAKVTDFGLSSMASSEAEVRISGAYYWVSPECLLDSNTRPTFASDVYSLGMCIVEALRVVEAVRAGKEDPQDWMPWCLSDITVVKHHVKRGRLPYQPESCDVSQWNLVKRMCVFDPKQRIKISTVVDELAILTSSTEDKKPAETAPSDLVVQEVLPEVITSSRKLLTQLRASKGRYEDSVLSLYHVLWDHIEQVHGQIDDRKPIAGCWGPFQSLISDAQVLTEKLQTMDTTLVSVAETTMRCYALRRRLNKLCDAYFLDCPSDSESHPIAST